MHAVACSSLLHHCEWLSLVWQTKSAKMHLYTQELLRLQVMIRLQYRYFPKCDNPVDSDRVNWGPLIIGDEVTTV